MSAQTTYSYATGKGIAGGIYDLFHYPIDTRRSTVDNGKLRPGMGVVIGTAAGAEIALPIGGKTAKDFDGIVVNGNTNVHDLDGHVFVRKDTAVGVMRYGRIWACLAAEQAPKYGDSLHMIVEGEDAGCFATSGGVELAGRFIGEAADGIAPVELFGASVPAGV